MQATVHRKRAKSHGHFHISFDRNINGPVVEYIVVIDVTRVRFRADLSHDSRGDRTHDRTLTTRMLSVPTKIRRQLRFIMCGPYELDLGRITPGCNDSRKY